MNRRFVWIFPNVHPRGWIAGGSAARETDKRGTRSSGFTANENVVSSVALRVGPPTSGISRNLRGRENSGQPPLALYHYSPFSHPLPRVARYRHPPLAPRYSHVVGDGSLALPGFNCVPERSPPRSSPSGYPPSVMARERKRKGTTTRDIE